MRIAPASRAADVDLDAARRVVLNGKGMSVAPHWRELPFFLIPRRLVKEVPAARGSSSLYCFVMGDGEFQDGEISENLTLRVDSTRHGIVVPLSLVSIDRFQADLAATREHWTVDEI